MNIKEYFAGYLMCDLENLTKEDAEFLSQHAVTLSDIISDLYDLGEEN